MFPLETTLHNHVCKTHIESFLAVIHVQKGAIFFHRLEERLGIQWELLELPVVFAFHTRTRFEQDAVLVSRLHCLQKQMKQKREEETTPSFFFWEEKSSEFLK